MLAMDDSSYHTNMTWGLLNGSSEPIGNVGVYNGAGGSLFNASATGGITVSTAVPETATWAMMLFVIGYTVRRRHNVSVAYA